MDPTGHRFNTKHERRGTASSCFLICLTDAEKTASAVANKGAGNLPQLGPNWKLCNSASPAGVVYCESFFWN